MNVILSLEFNLNKLRWLNTVRGITPMGIAASGLVLESRARFRCPLSNTTILMFV